MVDAPTFRDNFTSLDRTRWSTTFLDGTRTLPNNNEYECYEDSGITTGASGLVLTATRGAANSLNLPWRSGMLCEFDNQARTWGYWEIVAQMPSGPGFWPAFWSLFKGGWPPENDIVEMIGNTTKLFCSIHSKDSNAKQITSYPATVSDASVGFHKFGGYCGPDRVSFYYDDVLVGTAPTPSDYNAGQFMLINLAVGGPGSWPVTSYGAVPSNVSEAYFRVKRYSYYALGSWPSGQAIPSTLAATLTDTGATTPTTPPPSATTPATGTPSANGKTVRTPADGPIYNLNGIPFTLVASATGLGQQIAINGTVVANTQNVDILYYTGGVVYQHNTFGDWYSLTQGGVGTKLSAPPSGYAAPVVTAGTSHLPTLTLPATAGNVYVRVYASATSTVPLVQSGPITVSAALSAPLYTESLDPTAVLTVGPAITDASGNVSTISSGGQVVTNGAAETITANVNLLFYTGHQFFQRNTAGNWYLRTGAGAYATNPVADPRPAVSADRTLVTTVGPKVTDSTRATSSITSGGQVLTDGVVESVTANVVAIYVTGGVFYQKNTAGNWYQRSGSNAYIGTPVADPTVAPPAGTTGTYFHVSNGQILRPDGTVFHAKGVNCTPYTNYQPSTYAAVKALFPGINFIRLVTAAGYAQGGQNAATVAQFISDATSDHCVCLVDNHSLGTTATGSTLSAAVSWYSGLANTYKGNAYVWFGSENEPDGSYTAITAAHTATYNAVRNTGNGTIVTLDLRGGAYTEFMAGQGSVWSGMTNIVWDAHIYGWITQVYGGSGQPYDVGTTAAAVAGEIAAVQAYHSADGIVPCIIGECGPSTSGAANTTDANAAQIVSAVLNGSYGFAAWALNGTSTPGGDSLSDNGTTLTAWGQQVAARIAQNP